MSIPKWFWVYIKNWACLKKLSMLKPNFEKADGLGICWIDSNLSWNGMFGFFWLLTFDVNNNYFSSIFLVEAKHLTRITYPRGNFHSHWRMTFICVTWVSLHLKNFKLKWCDVFRTKLILEPFLMPNRRITRKLPTFR